ncbi:hypothetical protein [Rhizobium sp. CG4]|nr:hypothetical protein [Rhizobium sp. CG4]
MKPRATMWSDNGGSGVTAIITALLEGKKSVAIIVGNTVAVFLTP